LLLCSPLFAGNGAEMEKQTSANKPNVIFILADDSGFSDLGYYGSSISTPQLDSLAANGLIFTQFYNTGRCWPTRAALMTGFYPQQVHHNTLANLGGGGNGQRQAWARLLPDFLEPHGYRSYHSGKWHIDRTVLATGFDRSLNIVNQGNYFTNKQKHGRASRFQWLPEKVLFRHLSPMERSIANAYGGYTGEIGLSESATINWLRPKEILGKCTT